MKEKRPLILVSNDDGVTAKGVNELVRYIRTFGDVVMVAPDSPQSGMGCAVSASTPIHYREVHKEEGLEIYACSGTPVDCVKLAKNVLLDRNPDLLVSGINHGDNSAVNVHYSGTVGAAIEGCISEIPSLAFSLCNHDADADFSAEKLEEWRVKHIIDRFNRESSMALTLWDNPTDVLKVTITKAFIIFYKREGNECASYKYPPLHQLKKDADFIKAVTDCLVESCQYNEKDMNNWVASDNDFPPFPLSVIFHSDYQNYDFTEYTR